MAQVAAISQQIWDMKYRLKGPDGAPVDKTIEDSWRRVAEALAEAEARKFARSGPTASSTPSPASSICRPAGSSPAPAPSAT